MTLPEIVTNLEKGLMPPEQVVEARNYVASLLYKHNIEYGKLSASCAQWIISEQEKFKSHAAVERAWEASEDGQKMVRAKYAIRALEHISESLATNWFLYNREAKNQM